MVKDLVWETIDGTFGKDWVAEVSGFDNRYYVYIDRNTGKTIGINVNREKIEFNSIDSAKTEFQKDFNKRVLNLLWQQHTTSS